MRCTNCAADVRGDHIEVKAFSEVITGWQGEDSLRSRETTKWAAVACSPACLVDLAEEHRVREGRPEPSPYVGQDQLP